MQSFEVFHKRPLEISSEDENAAEKNITSLKRSICSETFHNPEGTPSESRFSQLLDDLLEPGFGLDGAPFDLSAVDGTSHTTLRNVGEDVQHWASEHLVSFDVPLMETDNQNHSERIECCSDFVGSPGVICFGTINKAVVKLTGNMSHVRKAFTECEAVSGMYGFGVFVDRSQLCLKRGDDFPLGILDAHTASACQELMTASDVTFEVFLKVSLCHKVILSSKSNEATLPASINIYGSLQHRDTVGSVLSSAKLYLQHPENPGKLYKPVHNPHYLHFPHIDESVLAQKQLLARPLEIGQGSEETPSVMSEVYNKLKRGDFLERLVKDVRIKTNLLEHQEKALKFMVEKEFGPVSDAFSLWRSIEVDGESGYQHIITESFSPTPPEETGGGIIADTMGMGKSLTVLSNIARSLAEGHNWAQSTGTYATDIFGCKIRSGATLIVVPSLLVLSEWYSEVEKHFLSPLKMFKYHGKGRHQRLKDNADSDIILTTYHTLVADMNSTRSPIEQIAWFRLVLDEAHIIRRYSTKLHRAVTTLTSRFRWCLTGTPVQNSLEDIGSLLSFVRAYPFDNAQIFRKHVILPFHRDRDAATERLRQLLDSLCLRRTTELLNLPGIQEVPRDLEFSNEERQQYSDTKNFMERMIKQRANEKNAKSNPFSLFQAQLHLRILCNHGTFQKSFSRNPVRDLELEGEAIFATLGRNGDVKCSRCGEMVPMLSTICPVDGELACKHRICPECVPDWYTLETGSGGDTSSQRRCPLCVAKHRGSSNATPNQQAASIPRPQNPSGVKPHFNMNGSSTKMRALLTDIKAGITDAKSIVFSCWTRSLDLVQIHLQQAEIPFARIDGDCELGRRREILSEYSADRAVPVLLMTTGTGAFGLNLAVVSRIFILEPQWNPSVEIQAIGRALRLGQDQRVFVYRYIICETVEDGMRSQQKEKVRWAKVGWKEDQKMS